MFQGRVVGTVLCWCVLWACAAALNDPRCLAWVWAQQAVQTVRTVYLQQWPLSLTIYLVCFHHDMGRLAAYQLCFYRDKGRLANLRISAAAAVGRGWGLQVLERELMPRDRVYL